MAQDYQNGLCKRGDSTRRLRSAISSPPAPSSTVTGRSCQAQRTRIGPYSEAKTVSVIGKVEENPNANGIIEALRLALHRFAARNSRPIPQFLLIDQPTQVYFPSGQVYKEADGSVQKTEADADLKAVRRLFELLLKFTQDEVPGFQLIVTEHANLREEWFQNTLVEQPWTKPPALVPEDWPK